MDRIHVKLYLFNCKGSLKEVRRVNISLKLEFAGLHDFLKHLITSTCNWSSFELEYKDNEGDNIALCSQAEWEECLLLHTGVHMANPLRLHLKKVKDGKKGKKRPDTEQMGVPQQSLLQPDHFYHAGPGPAVTPEHLTDIQNLVPEILHRYLPETMSLANCPDWIRNSVSFQDGAVDVNIQRFADALNKRALELMECDPCAALHHFMETNVLQPTFEKKYNIACCFSLMGKIPQAISALQESVAEGYCNFKHMLNDPDLMAVRSVPEFMLLLQRNTAAEATPVSDVEVIVPDAPTSMPATVEEEVSVPEPVHVAPIEKFAAELHKVHLMGFWDDDRTVALLVTHNGDLQLVVDSLLP